MINGDSDSTCDQQVTESGSSQKAVNQPGVPLPKRIVLFSDGTGNSSAKLFKTNVWRMYEAVDLGPPPPGALKQISFYDDGVGTSSIKPLAMLGGIFGYGLKRNVLDIYRYACRNYRPAPGQKLGEEPPEGGDEIYGFGFSRGAFTMRVAIAMIAKVGLVVTKDEAELDRRAKEAWRVYRAGYRPRNWPKLSDKGAAKVKTTLLQERSRNFHPIIRFIGVWDTVAAYGGPIQEITRAFDNWVVRLSMPNYELADAVRCARHALALDDERDSFHPLLWDELHEERVAGRRDWINENRLQQVWFTGMHADVGGGYPDESLSYVSFLWMMEEAEKKGLRFSPVMIERFRALANSAGPIHDSRSGVGSYYRYRPRRIAVWMEPIDKALLTRRHPDRKRGLIRRVKVHESVAARIASGTDRYAPISLPAEIDVVPPQREGENAPAGQGAFCGRKPAGPPLPLITEELRKRFENEGLGEKRVEAMHGVWAQVRSRRRLYFVSLFLTLALVTMPLWGDLWMPPVLASGHGLLSSVIGLLGAFLPGFLTAIVESWANHPFFLLVLGLALLATNRWARSKERKLRDDTRRIWDDALDLSAPTKAGAAQELAEEKPDDTPETRAPSFQQRVRRFIRWRAVPALIFVALLLMLLWLLFVIATRISLSVLERGEALCPAPTERRPLDAASGFHFDTSSACHSTGLIVTKGQRYTVQMVVGEAWADGPRPADPRGLAAGDVGFLGYVGVPQRRVVGARYLQPIVRISADGSAPILQPLELQQRGTPPNLWRGEFTAARSGTLSLFANEAMLPAPLNVTEFYTHRTYGNRGTAVVTIIPAG